MTKVSDLGRHLHLASKMEFKNIQHLEWLQATSLVTSKSVNNCIKERIKLCLNSGVAEKCQILKIALLFSCQTHSQHDISLASTWLILYHSFITPSSEFFCLSDTLRTEASSDVRNPQTPTDFNNLYMLSFLLRCYKNKFMLIPQMHIHCCCQSQVRNARHVFNIIGFVFFKTISL